MIVTCIKQSDETKKSNILSSFDAFVSSIEFCNNEKSFEFRFFQSFDERIDQILDFFNSNYLNVIVLNAFSNKMMSYDNVLDSLMKFKVLA